MRPPPPPPSDDDGEYSDVLSTPPQGRHLRLMTRQTTAMERKLCKVTQAILWHQRRRLAIMVNNKAWFIVPALRRMTDVREKATAAESAWKRFTHDASGKYYYYNSQTGKTQWTRPVEYTGDYDDDSDLTSVSSMASSAVTLKTAKSLAAMSIGSSNSMKDGETPKWKKYIDDATGRRVLAQCGYWRDDVARPWGVEKVRGRLHG